MQKVTGDQIKALESSYEFILVYAPDIHGILRSKTYPARHAALLENDIAIVSLFALSGVKNELIMIPKCVEINFGNILMKPDLSTIASLPWFGAKKNAKFAGVFCDTYWTKDEVMTSNTRNMAKRQLELLEAEGYQLCSGYEYEFRLFKGESVDCSVNDLVPAHSDMQMFHSSFVNKYQDFLIDLERSLNEAGVDIEYMTTEYGSGMWEMPFRPKFDIIAADSAAIFKDGVRHVAINSGYRATFMCKPIPKESGNGCHYNHSIWVKRTRSGPPIKNAFYDPKSENNLSEFAIHWIGGLVEHSNALTALCSPTINCFRRLHSPWAPDKTYWQMDDRQATFRVKSSSESGCYIENRLGTAAANPYLLLAGTVAAGLDGVRRKLMPPAAGSQERGLLPMSLTEAIEALQKDVYMVEALGKEFVDVFKQIKEESELTTLANIDLKNDVASDYDLEREHYFDYV